MKVNKVNKDIYLTLVCAPTFFFFIEKYKFEHFLNTINKNAVSKITSKISRTCSLIFKKVNIFGLTKDKNVSIQRPIQIIESETTNLNPFNLLNIKI